MYKRRNRLSLAVILLVVIGLVIIVVSMFSNGDNPRDIVEEFYTYEQEARYSESWGLFHPMMKEKWTKTAYITDRTHVFNGHFGAETFTYSIEEIGESDQFKMSEDTKAFNKAHQFKVSQTYLGKYGKFTFVQELYVVKYKEEWVIIWDYKH